MLGVNTHGKGRVRVLKVRRNGGKDEISQFTVTIWLHGPVDKAYTHEDNSYVIATDTQKNTCYCLANDNEFDSIEEYGMILARHFLTNFPDLVKRINITIKEDIWERIVAADSSGVPREHNHAFQKIGPHYSYCEIEGESHNGPRDISFKVKAGIKNLTVLKTTQSGFANFVRDRYTSLPDVDDRLVATSVEAEWNYDSRTSSSRPDWAGLRRGIIAQIIDTFVGPSDVGVWSASVQATLYYCGRDVINNFREVEDITIYMPNIHNLPLDLSAYGCTNKDHTGNPHVFQPTDEPHGMIKAQVVRSRARL